MYSLSHTLGIKKLAVEENNSLCVDYNMAVDAAKQKPRFGVCPKLPVFKSISIMNRCIPEDLITFGKDLLQKVVELDWIRGYLHDLVDSSPFLLQMCLVALVLALFSIALLRFFAAVIVYFVYLAVALLAIGFSGTAWYVFWKAYRKSLTPRSNDTVTEVIAPTLTPTAKPRHITAAVFIVTAVWCVLPRGKKMIRLFKGASRALSAMPSLLLQPLINAALVLMVAVYTLSVVLVLFTSGSHTLILNSVFV
ncbi:unnamed protein product [Strongylus vulgaris]|uniref:Choline transporter-like protein n=1 Tax=Strongylus vulgaris TaxID=40348 RepID=A0A3P7LVY0_STRVU|nr:unnamed protein product [Strongylus vulgaris]